MPKLVITALHGGRPRTSTSSHHHSFSSCSQILDFHPSHRSSVRIPYYRPMLPYVDTKFLQQSVHRLVRRLQHRLRCRTCLSLTRGHYALLAIDLERLQGLRYQRRQRSCLADVLKAWHQLLKKRYRQKPAPISESVAFVPWHQS